MADGTIGGVNNLDPGIYGSPKQSAAEAKKKSDEISKNDFMQLLVTQLKNQDPLNPMENQEFAVQLAQFSSLEQLVSINEKLAPEESSFGDFASLAGFLGNEVTLNSSVARVNEGNGGKITFQLPSDAAAVQVELVGADGSVAQTIAVGARGAGKNTVSLSNLTAANGDYQVRVTAVSQNGGTINPEAHTSGIVSGFIPGPDPKLIVNGIEISAADIKEVHVPSAT